MPRGIELDSVLPELLGAIGIGDGWAIQAVAEAIQVPVLEAIGVDDGGSVLPVEEAIKEPSLGPIGIDDDLDDLDP